MYFLTGRVKNPDTLEAIQSMQDFVDETLSDVEPNEDNTKSVSMGIHHISKKESGEIRIVCGEQNGMIDELLYVHDDKARGSLEHLYGRVDRVGKHLLGPFIVRIETELRKIF